MCGILFNLPGMLINQWLLKLVEGRERNDETYG